MGPGGRRKGRPRHCTGHGGRSRGRSRLPDRTVSVRSAGAHACARAPGKADLFAHGTIRLSTVADPHGQAAGGRHPQGAADGRDRRVRLGQDDHGAGEPDPRAGGRHPRQRAAGARPGGRAPTASRRSSSSTPRPSASTSAPPWPPMPACTTSCASSMPDRRMPRRCGCKAGDFSYNTGSLRCPGCDGTGVDQPGRAVSAGCGHPLPGLPRLALRTDAAYDVQLTNKAGQAVSLPGADGHGRQHRARRSART